MRCNSTIPFSVLLRSRVWHRTFACAEAGLAHGMRGTIRIACMPSALRLTESFLHRASFVASGTAAAGAANLSSPPSAAMLVAAAVQRAAGSPCSTSGRAAASCVPRGVRRCRNARLLVRSSALEQLAPPPIDEEEDALFCGVEGAHLGRPCWCWRGPSRAAPPPSSPAATCALPALCNITQPVLRAWDALEPRSAWPGARS